MTLLPVALSALLSLPGPTLHLTHKLLPAPGEKSICEDTAPHLTFDVCVFILGYCLPVALIVLLGFGLLVRLV